ncbi:MAG: hypothetical protein CL763_06880 [Chloroflexi bacterium]|nr:hypothetical protein [Chloroflexota bacterium]
MVTNIFRIYGFDSISHFNPIKIDDDIILQKIQVNEDSMVIALVHNDGTRWYEPQSKAKNQMNFQESPPVSLRNILEFCKNNIELVESLESIVEENLTRLRVFLACYQLHQEDGPFLKPTDGYYKDMAIMPNVFHNPATNLVLYELLSDGNKLSVKYRELPINDFLILPPEYQNKFIKLLLLPKGVRDQLPLISDVEEKIDKSKDYHKKVKDIITNKNKHDFNTRNRLILSLINYQDAKEGLDTKWGIIKFWSCIETFFNRAGKIPLKGKQVNSCVRVLLSQLSENPIDNFAETKDPNEDFLRKMYDIRSAILHGHIHFSTHGGRLETDKRHLANISKSLIKIMIEKISSGKSLMHDKPEPLPPDSIISTVKKEAKKKFPEIWKDRES